MTEAQKTAIRDKIIAELSRIATDIETLEKVTRPDGEDREDDITRMNSIVNKSVNDAALAAARARLAGLEYALKRINEPDFGYCIDCGEEIPVARLLAMPETSRCIDCAQ